VVRLAGFRGARILGEDLADSENSNNFAEKKENELTLQV
jgi:hypothetical protein